MQKSISSAARASRARKAYRFLGTAALTLGIGIACDLASEFLRGLF